MATADGTAPGPGAGPKRSFGIWLGLAVLVVGLVNGAGPFLRRVGFVDRARYEAFWELHTGPAGFTTAPFGLGRRCVSHRPAEEGGAAIEGGGPAAGYVLEVAEGERPLKALKDLLALSVAAAALLLALRGGPPIPAPSPALAALAVLVGAQAAAGLARGEAAATLAGLRSFEFLGVALLAGAVAGELLRRLVPWLVALVAVQAALAPVELLRGIPVQGHMGLFGEIFARRAAGTFVMPNTLGVAAAAVAALAATLGGTRRVRAWGWISGCLAVLLSGSATGLVGLAAAGIFAAGRARSRGKAAALASGLAALFVLSALAFAWHRPDVADSFAGRRAGLVAAFRRPVAEVVFGRGLGAGTSAARQVEDILGDRGAPRGGGAGGGESALASLLAQTGLAGVALAGGAAAAAFRRRRETRPLLAVLALSGLTLGVAEAYPLGLILGLALGDAARRS